MAWRVQRREKVIYITLYTCLQSNKWEGVSHEYNPKTKVHAVTMNCVYTTEGSSMGPPHLVTLTGKLNNFDQFKVDPPMWKLNKDNNRYECFAPDNSAMYDGTRGGDNCPFMVVDPVKPRTVPSRIETH